MQEEEEDTLYQKRKRLTLCSALLSLITEPPLSTPFFLSQRSGRKQKESKVQVSLRVAQAREERPVFAITSRVGGSERWVIRVSIHTVHFSLGRHIFIHHFPLSFFFLFLLLLVRGFARQRFSLSSLSFSFRFVPSSYLLRSTASRSARRHLCVSFSSSFSSSSSIFFRFRNVSVFSAAPNAFGVRDANLETF